MSLPSSGQISLGQIRSELGLSGQVSLGQGSVRSLAGVATGQIGMSNLHGKSAIVTNTVTNGTVSTVRGYNKSYGIGSISPGSYNGRVVDGVWAQQAVPDKLTINFAGTTNPGWSTVHINGTAYPAASSAYDSKTATYTITVTITNVYNTLVAGGPFQIGFS